MMFRRLVSVDDFRLFKEWKDEESERPHRFGRWTLIYGPNGSGKSTLANIFQAIEDAQQAPEKLDARLAGVHFELTDGSAPRTVAAQPNRLPPVLVFNRKYVDRNLRQAFDRGGHATPLFVLGAVNVELEDEIQRLEVSVEQKKAHLAEMSKKAKDCERQKRELLESVKGRVEAELGTYDGSRYNTQRFNVKRAQDLLDRPRQHLEPEQLAEQRSALKTVPENVPGPVNVPRLRDVSMIEGALLDVAGFEVTSKTIRRLEEDKRMADWSQVGLGLHADSDRCGFCDGPLRSERLAELRAHFDTTYTVLQTKVERARQAVEELQDEYARMRDWVAAIAEQRPDFAHSVTEVHDRFMACVEEAMQWLEAARSMLKERADSPFSMREWQAPTAPDMSPWQELHAHAERHNQALEEKKRNADQIRRHAETLILQHIAAEHYQSYAARVTDLEEAQQGRTAAASELERLEDELGRAHAQRTEQRDGVELAEKLTSDLAGYLGHQQIAVHFEVQDGAKGFTIKRSGMPATDLSEGERNALALLYFLRSLDAHGTVEKLNQACIVIDDPVSSLDQDAILFAVERMNHQLRSSVDGPMRCKQVIILTHNFSFFHRWKDRLKRNVDADFAEKSDYDEMAEYRATALEFATYVSYDSEVIRKEPLLRRLGPPLKNLVAEYFFLFHCACEASHDPGDLRMLMSAGNSARRMLETFVRFKMPELNDMAHGIRVVSGRKNVPLAIRGRIEALNQASHRRDPDLHGQSFSASIRQDVQAALGFIKAVDRDHFDGLCKQTGVEPRLGAYDPDVLSEDSVNTTKPGP